MRKERLKCILRLLMDFSITIVTGNRAANNKDQMFHFT